MGRCIHLRVENAGWCLNNADGFIVDRDSVEGAFAVLKYGNELQAQVLGVHVGGKGVRDTLFGAGWDLDGVFAGC